MEDVKTSALPTRIDYFKYEWGFLSNFSPAEVYLWVDAQGMIWAHEIDNPVAIELYASVEHAYQAAKSLDAKERWIFQVTNNPNLSPAKAKDLGRKFKEKGKERPDWKEVNVGIMRDLLRQKFQLSTLRRKLLATMNAYLEEGNYWHDTFWGVCKGELDGRTCRHGKHDPEGENWLGWLLMEVRAEISGIPNPFTRS